MPRARRSLDATRDAPRVDTPPLTSPRSAPPLYPPLQGAGTLSAGRRTNLSDCCLLERRDRGIRLLAMRNPLKEKLAAGKAISIAMVTMPSVPAMQLWARSGVDCLIVDQEHGPIGVDGVHALVAATQGTGATPIVRVPWTVPWLIKPVLDTGAMGICFPM